MPRLLRALLPALAGLALASVARAGLVVPACSTIPKHICLVGSTAGVPDTVAGRFAVTLRDEACDPMQGTSVTVEFDVTRPVKVAVDPLDPRLKVVGYWPSVLAFTDAYGVAVFTIVGSAPAGAGPVTASIFGNGVLLGHPTVSSYDLDGAGGVSGADLAVWADDYFSGSNPGRSDFDGSGTVTGADLAMFAKVLFSGRDTETGALCP